MQVKNLYIETLKGRKLINDLSFNLNEGDKIAIIVKRVMESRRL